jgi:hypothetical protein
VVVCEAVPFQNPICSADSGIYLLPNGTQIVAGWLHFSFEEGAYAD